MGQAPAVLVGHGGQDAQPVQFLCDVLCAGSVNAAAVNVLHHTGGVLVNDEVILILRVLSVAVDRAGPHIVPVLPLGQQCAPGFHRNIPAIGIVQQIFQADMQIIAVLLVGGVDAIIDGNETDPVGGKHLPEIAASLDVLPAQAGQVLDDHAVDLAGNNVIHHLLERRAVEQNAAVTVVHPLRYQLNVRVRRHKVLDQLLLIGNAVTLHAAVSGVGEAQVCVTFGLRHKKSLLCKCRTHPAMQRSD